MEPPHKESFGDYEVFISEVFRWKTPPAIEEAKDTLHISKKGKEVYYAESAHFWIGDMEDLKNPSRIKIGDDITDDGVPDLVISDWGSDGYGYLTYTVFSLGEELKVLGKMNAKQDSKGSFKDLDGDGVPEFLGNDFSLLKKATTGVFYEDALAKAPELIYQFKNGGYQPAASLMKETKHTESSK